MFRFTVLLLGSIHLGEPVQDIGVNLLAHIGDSGEPLARCPTRPERMVGDRGTEASHNACWRFLQCDQSLVADLHTVHLALVCHLNMRTGPRALNIGDGLLQS